MVSWRMLFRRGELVFLVLAVLITSLIVLYGIYSWTPSTLKGIQESIPWLRGKNPEYIISYIKKYVKENRGTSSAAELQGLLQGLEAQLDTAALDAVSSQTLPFSYSFTHVTVLFLGLVFLGRLDSLVSSGMYALLASATGDKHRLFHILLRDWLKLALASIMIIIGCIIVGYVSNPFISVWDKAGDIAFVILVFSSLILFEAVLTILMLAPLVFRGMGMHAILFLALYVISLNYLQELGGLPLLLASIALRPADVSIFLLDLYYAHTYPQYIIHGDEALNLAKYTSVAALAFQALLLLTLWILVHWYIEERDLNI